MKFQNIRQNGYYIETTNDEKKVSDKKCVLEKLSALFSSLYYTNINMIETHALLNKKFTNPNTFIIWHDRLGHPKSIMCAKSLKTHMDIR